MPVNKKKMKAMKEEYGKKAGEQIYYKMENSEKHSGKMSDFLPKKKKK